MRNKKIFYLLNIVIPLMIGSFIYIYIGEDICFVNYLKDYIRFNHINKNNILFQIIRNYLCDFCWCYSLSSCMTFIYKKESNVITSIMIPTGVGIALEILQGFGIINGTMDMMDIFVELMGCILSYLLLKGKQYE